MMGGDGGEGEVREGGPPEAKRLVSPLLDRLEEKVSGTHTHTHTQVTHPIVSYWACM